jgi:hypothetical protein
MLDKIEQELKFYNEKLERKKRIIQPYLDKKNNNIDMNEKEYTVMKVLESEINLIQSFINDLEYLKENITAAGA